LFKLKCQVPEVQRVESYMNIESGDELFPKHLTITVSVEALNDSCFRFEFSSLVYSVLYFKLVSLGGEVHFSWGRLVPRGL